MSRTDSVTSPVGSMVFSNSPAKSLDAVFSISFFRSSSSDSRAKSSMPLWNSLAMPRTLRMTWVTVRRTRGISLGPTTRIVIKAIIESSTQPISSIAAT